MARVSIKERNLIFVLIGLIILVVILASIFVFIPKNKINVNTILLTPESNINSSIVSESLEISDSFNSSKLHWSHMPISYKINNNCGQRYLKIKSGFSQIEKETNGVVSFIEVSSGEDISVECSSKPSEISDGERETLGYAYYNVYADYENIIYNSTITFYPTLESCGYFPFLEIHEILHTFGYDHSEDKNSVMYETTNYCLERYENEDVYGEVRIDDSIIEDLTEIYSK